MRKEGWEKELNDYMERMAHANFEWGVCDCLIYASDACVLLTGKDPMSKAKDSDPETIRGAYKSEKEAKALIRKYRRSTPNIMDVHFERINPNFSQRGDILGAKLDTGMAFGVCWAGKALFKTDTNGFTALDLNECKYAWRVE